MIRHPLKIALACAFAVAIAAGCAVRSGAPVFDRAPEARPVPGKPALTAKPAPRSPESRAEFHTVGRGETLYSIALDYGLDYRELAQWNGITDPAVIKSGQQLRLRPPAGTPASTAAATAAPLKAAPGVQGRPLGETPATAGEEVKTQPKAVRLPYSAQTYAELASVKPEPAQPEMHDARPATAKGEDGVEWSWPASGRVVSGFNGTTAKGITIAGKLGQPVLASAAGRVIFSGTGIRGLGKFIVIKHNDAFISVYAHNSEILVKYGQSVVKGQKIAEMGATDADQVKLHFEIRRFGSPVDPMRLLPPA